MRHQGQVVGAEAMNRRPPFLDSIDRQVQWGRPGQEPMPDTPNRWQDGSHIEPEPEDEDREPVGWRIAEIVVPLILLGVCYWVWTTMQ